MPAYTLNADLAATAAPPVPLARAWAATFPGKATHAEARELPLLNLAQGVPGHLPSEALLARMQQEAGREPAAAAGYGGVFGAPELRKALAADVRQRYGGDCAEDDVAITAGANLAAAVAFQAVARRGDAVVLPTPWVSSAAASIDGDLWDMQRLWSSSRLSRDARPCGAHTYSLRLLPLYSTSTTR
jgi:aspartate/methionine/tyrosine aminotransferase